MTEIEAKEIFSAYGLPTVTTKLATSEGEAVKHAEEIGYPVIKSCLA